MLEWASTVATLGWIPFFMSTSLCFFQLFSSFRLDDVCATLHPSSLAIAVVLEPKGRRLVIKLQNGILHLFWALSSIGSVWSWMLPTGILLFSNFGLVVFPLLIVFYFTWANIEDGHPSFVGQVCVQHLASWSCFTGRRLRVFVPRLRVAERVILHLALCIQIWVVGGLVEVPKTRAIAIQ